MAEQVITEADWNAVTQEREAPPEEKTPPPEQPPQTEPEAKPAEEAAPPAEEKDPYANLSPEVRAKLERFDELAANQAQLVTAFNEAKGRISSLQSQWDKARQQASAEPTKAQLAAAAKDPEKWESLKKDYPEWGEAISEFVETRLGSLSAAKEGPTSEEIEQLVAQRTEAATADLKKQLNEALVKVKHPNWKTEIKTDDFGNWFAAQTPETKALAASEDGFDAIQLLDLFHEHKAKSAKTVIEDRQQRQAAAAGDHRPGAKAVVAKRVEDMTPEEIWQYEAQRRTATG
jgi:hypothetical protein